MAESELPTPKERMLWLWTNLVGQLVQVSCTDGLVWEGVMEAKGEEDICVGLLWARQKASKSANLKTKMATKEHILFNASDIISVNAVDVLLTKPEVHSIHNSSHEHAGSERDLVSWTAGPDVPESVELEDTNHSIRGWDQFEANKRFGVYSSYDENLYTTKLDTTKLTREQIEAAARITREIEQGVGGGKLDTAAWADDFDEEALHSAVIRVSDKVSVDQYENALAKLAPTSEGAYLPPHLRRRADQGKPQVPSKAPTVPPADKAAEKRTQPPPPPPQAPVTPPTTNSSPSPPPAPPAPSQAVVSSTALNATPAAQSRLSRLQRPKNAAKVAEPVRSRSQEIAALKKDKEMLSRRFNEKTPQPDAKEEKNAEKESKADSTTPGSAKKLNPKAPPFQLRSETSASDTPSEQGGAIEESQEPKWDPDLNHNFASNQYNFISKVIAQSLISRIKRRTNPAEFPGDVGPFSHEWELGGDAAWDKMHGGDKDAQMESKPGCNAAATPYTPNQHMGGDFRNVQQKMQGPPGGYPPRYDGYAPQNWGYQNQYQYQQQYPPPHQAPPMSQPMVMHQAVPHQQQPMYPPQHPMQMQSMRSAPPSGPPPGPPPPHTQQQYPQQSGYYVSPQQPYTSQAPAPQMSYHMQPGHQMVPPQPQQGYSNVQGQQYQQYVPDQMQQQMYSHPNARRGPLPPQPPPQRKGPKGPMDRR